MAIEVTKSLITGFNESLAQLDPYERAKQIASRLSDVAHELATEPTHSSVHKELNEYDAHCCELAVEALYKMSTEVERLRLSILHFGAGQMSRHDLCAAAKTWNKERA